MRGTRKACKDVGVKPRITPAHAGNTETGIDNIDTG